MPLVELVLILIVAGILSWLFNNITPNGQKIRQIIDAVVFSTVKM